MKKIYEFLLWNNCLFGNCSFCHQRAHELRITDKILIPSEQVESLLKCQEFLNTQFEKGNHILLVGGEIFDVKNEEVKQALTDLLQLIIDKMNIKEIDLLYLNTNLLYFDTDLLHWFLVNIQKNSLFDRLRFTTSYDMVGRYRTKNSEQLFYKNLKTLTDRFDDIKIVVNTVLTKEACKRICNDCFGADYLQTYLRDQNKDTFTIKDWMDYFRVEINTIPYIRLDNGLAPEMPTKKEVFDTLLHINSIIPGYLNKYSNNIALKQEKLLFEYNKKDKVFVYCSSKLSDCGHSVNFKLSFSDSNACFPCEIEKLSKYQV